MSDLFGNHIVGFSMRWLIYIIILSGVPGIVNVILASQEAYFHNFLILNEFFLIMSF